MVGQHMALQQRLCMRARLEKRVLAAHEKTLVKMAPRFCLEVSKGVFLQVEMSSEGGSCKCSGVNGGAVDVTLRRGT